MKKLLRSRGYCCIISIHSEFGAGAFASTNNNNVPEQSVPATSETTTLPDSASLSSDSLNILTENTNFQNHGFEVKALTEAVNG